MLQYLIKFSLSLAVLYIFYRAVLRPLTFYQCNRFYLLSYSLLSFVIPFINITPWVSAHDNQQFINVIPAIGNYHIVADQQTGRPSLLQRLTLTDWLLIVFCIGATVVFVRLIVQYLSLRRIRQKAVLLNTGGDIQLYETSAPVGPFSFGNAIYFNRSLHSEEELQRIIQHEFVHVKQKHTIDLITGELLCVVNWFNPFAWLIRCSIRQNLEFIADSKVLANGLDKKEYQYLLLKVVGIPQYSIASNFNFSNLKKRIAMMNKMTSAKIHLTKFLFVLPLLVVLLLAFRNKINDNTNQNLFVFTGIIYDAKTSQPLENVSVKEKYFGISAVTDANGFFKIKIPVKDSVFKINCDFMLAGYEKADSRNLSFVPATVKTHADIIFAGMRKQNNPAYNGINISYHYQTPRDNKNQFVPDPDYAFVRDKFNEHKKQKEITDRIDALAKASKKPIWIIDGVPYAIGTGMRAWFDKEETASSGFKVWVDGKIMSMDAANAQANRDELVSVNASSAENSVKEYGINANLFVLKRKAIFNSSGNNNDTVPLPPPPAMPAAAASINKKGYIITVADNNGECVILVKNREQKIVKAMTLVEWNENKKENEKQYGEIPPPPLPVAPIKMSEAAPVERPVPPDRVKLPANVKGISIHTDINNQTNSNINTATVTLKNGKKEVYNLNDPKEKAAYIKKYGELPASPPAPPVPAIEAVTPNPAIEVRVKAGDGITAKGLAQPLYIVDGIENRYIVNANSIAADKIKSVYVLTGKMATIKYGEKGKNGVVEITMKQPLYIVDSVVQR